MEIDELILLLEKELGSIRGFPDDMQYVNNALVLLRVVRNERKSRLTQRAADVCPVCRGQKYAQTKSRGLVKCATCKGTGHAAKA